MNPVKKAPSDQRLRDEGDLEVHGPTTKGDRLLGRAPEVLLRSPEPRIAVGRSAEGGSAEPGQAKPIDIPVAELMALAKKNRPASGGRWRRTAAIAALAFVPVALGAAAIFTWDRLSGPSQGSLSPTTTATSSDAVPAAEPSAPKSAEASTPNVPLRTAVPLTPLTAVPAGSPSYSELEQRIKALAESLALVQESLEKVTALQERTALEVARLKNAEQEPGKRTLSSPVLLTAPPRRNATTRIAPPPEAEFPPPEPAPGSPAAAPMALSPPPETRSEPVLRPPLGLPLPSIPLPSLPSILRDR